MFQFRSVGGFLVFPDLWWTRQNKHMPSRRARGMGAQKEGAHTASLFHTHWGWPSAWFPAQIPASDRQSLSYTTANSFTLTVPKAPLSLPWEGRLICLPGTWACCGQSLNLIHQSLGWRLLESLLQPPSVSSVDPYQIFNLFASQIFNIFISTS